MMKSLMPLYSRQKTSGAEHQTPKLALIILVRYPIDRAILATKLLMLYSDHKNNKKHTVFFYTDELQRD